MNYSEYSVACKKNPMKYSIACTFSSLLCDSTVEEYTWIIRILYFLNDSSTAILQSKDQYAWCWYRRTGRIKGSTEGGTVPSPILS
mmetsp:Transcript_27069/g.25912  ORF Transcript_27069/g.25912 Transcript_27069/m.25912 type:complete len:86 (+) Transcript_27069:427-684(+)